MSIPTMYQNSTERTTSNKMEDYDIGDSLKKENLYSAIKKEILIDKLQNSNVDIGNNVLLDDEYLSLKREELDKLLPVLNEIVEEDYTKEFNREITTLTWNGAILNIEGYCYLKDFPIRKETDVQKKLVLVREVVKKNKKKKETRKFTLEDLPLSRFGFQDEIGLKNYKWAGFSGVVNFTSVVKKNNHPLPAGTYEVSIEIKVFLKNNKTIVKRIPLGDIRKFLKNGFYDTKIEYFSAKKQLVYNLMVTYDLSTKSMLIKSIKLADFNPTKIYGDVKNKTKKPGSFYRFMRTKMFTFLYYLFHIFPVKKDQVLFASDSRKEIGGNLKYVYEEMERQGIPYNYKFMFKENSFVKKSFLEIVKLAYYVATSKATLLEENYPMVSPLRTRKRADLIQLWHAAGAFKKFGYSRLGQPGGPKINSKDHRNYTKAVVSSKNIIPQYAEGFDIDREVIYPFGIPRTDIFYDEAYKEEIRAAFYEKYPFLKGKKIILFAPTFRGRGRKEAHYPFDNLDFEKLYNNLKDEYVFLFKLHYIVLNKVTIPYQYADFFYDFSDYREVNDLLVLADLLITDYSSICFEYSLLDKPMLFFAFDAESYISKRGFYYEYQSFIPGNLVKTTDEMVDKIVNKDFAQEKVKPFRDYFFDYQDGKASERVVNYLIKP